MHNTFRAILAMTTFLVTGALSSCNHTDELEPESPAPQIVFLFSPGGLGDMSYNDRILEGVQRFKMENGDIDIYIYSPESLQEAEKIFADWLERPQSSIPVLLFVLFMNITSTVTLLSRMQKRNSGRYPRPESMEILRSSVILDYKPDARYD